MNCEKAMPKVVSIKKGCVKKLFFTHPFCFARQFRKNNLGLSYLINPGYEDIKAGRISACGYFFQSHVVVEIHGFAGRDVVKDDTVAKS